MLMGILICVFFTKRLVNLVNGLKSITTKIIDFFF